MIRLLEDHLGEIGFNNDASGKQEAESFLRKVLHRGRLLLAKKNNQVFLITKAQKKHFHHVDTPKVPEKPKIRRRGRKLSKAVPKKPIRQKRETLIPKTPSRKSAPVPGPTRAPARTIDQRDLPMKLEKEMLMFKWKYTYENQLMELDEEFIRIIEQRKKLRLQLEILDTNIRKKCNALKVKET